MTRASDQARFWQWFENNSERLQTTVFGTDGPLPVSQQCRGRRRLKRRPRRHGGCRLRFPWPKASVPLVEPPAPAGLWASWRSPRLLT